VIQIRQIKPDTIKAQAESNQDYDQTLVKTTGVEHISSRLYIGNSNISYKNEYGAWDVITVHPGTQYLEEVEILSGRFVNDYDIKRARKAVAISDIIRDVLFKDSTKVLGEFINVRGVPFKVVGVFHDVSDRDNRRVYLPISTAQKVYNRGNNINNLAFTTGDMSGNDTKIVEEQLREQFARRHKFDPNDKRAIWIRNNVENYEQFQKLFNGIALFIWVIGFGTIIAGVVGVSNIMIITVKERTKEIGIRKAIGATPISIIGLILLEPIIIMATAGYIGLVIGIGLLEILAPQFENSETFFKQPGVDIDIAIKATILLIVFGAIAGFFPARRAAKIQPVVALRDE
jgi:putative ABC transport system permease protein